MVCQELLHSVHPDSQQVPRHDIVCLLICPHHHPLKEVTKSLSLLPAKQEQAHSSASHKQNELYNKSMAGHSLMVLSYAEPMKWDLVGRILVFLLN